MKTIGCRVLCGPMCSLLVLIFLLVVRAHVFCHALLLLPGCASLDPFPRHPYLIFPDFALLGLLISALIPCFETSLRFATFLFPYLTHFINIYGWINHLN